MCKKFAKYLHTFCKSVTFALVNDTNRTIIMMKKTISIAAMVLASLPMMAGGLLTNTNQNAAFLRNMAQDGQVTLTSLYANPAGNVFLSEGWHMSLNSQTAIQQRNISTTFPYFAANMANPGQQTHDFQGKAFAPVIPSISVSYNKPRWSVSAHFGLIGGGGKCEFDKGLGSFEALYSSTIAQQLPGMVNAQLPGMVAGNIAQMYQDAGIPGAQAQAMAAQLAAAGTYGSQMTGYGMDAYMKGRSYYFGLQLGGAYKILDNLSAYVGVRGVYGTCGYNGYVQDVKASYAYSFDVPANDMMKFPGASGQGAGSQDLSSQSLTLNADQQGFGITPIIGIDWEVNKHWNLSAKFEAPTKMSLKNKSEMNDFAKVQAAQEGNVLNQFADGTKIREDIPGILAFGAQYSPIEKVRLTAGFHEYFDKSAKKFADKQDLIDHNTWELVAGVEYDCCKLVTLSASWQKTEYGLSDEYMNDLSFNNSSNSLTFGLRLHPSKVFNIDLGYMHTFYQERTVNSLGGLKSDIYNRKNNAVGVGFNFAL